MSIEAMKKARDVLLTLDSNLIVEVTKLNAAIDALDDAIEYAESERPVAFITNKRQRMNIEIRPDTFLWQSTAIDWEMPLYTHPQPKAKQKPSGRWVSDKEYWEDPQPKREPLTDEQIDEATQKWAGHSMVSLDRLIMCREYARAIEAAHGIKEDA